MAQKAVLKRAEKERPPIADDGKEVAKTALVHLKVMADSCTLCELHKTRKRVAFSRGDGSSGLCIVGEAPGKHEDEQGVPFVGSSGQVVDKMIRGIGLDPAHVHICNVIKCRPPENRVPTIAEIAACSGYLMRQIQLVGPRVVVTLGQVATRAILGPEAKSGMGKIRGRWHRALNCDVMPTWHPSYCFRVPAAREQMFGDMRAVGEKLGVVP
jgi:DNA polymerase